MSEMQLPTTCALCRRAIESPYRLNNPDTAYCSNTCDFISALANPTITAPIDLIHENMRTYAIMHEPILRKLAFAMAGRFDPRFGWGDHKILLVHLKEAEHGRHQYVHHELKAKNFIRTVRSFGLTNKLELLARLNISNIMIILIYDTPDETHLVGYAIPLGDEIFEAGRGYDDLSEEIEALKASEERNFWPQSF
ncbi:hypothetical protein BD779DRAFT_1682143 [Infundibulicybe gibba]|nr:hypothetical protein BD779DRAFT_1682143 [Infundibulicybe gibba]